MAPLCQTQHQTRRADRSLWPARFKPKQNPRPECLRAASMTRCFPLPTHRRMFGRAPSDSSSPTVHSRTHEEGGEKESPQSFFFRHPSPL